ncbi:unnamed protein product, partial [Mesorhabditis belari]|uniref:Uncharacterized protein n=1 Tax=Mesorhabditis belari TaxID=2138241 RepID=A0AAF3EP31_9BILA
MRLWLLFFLIGAIGCATKATKATMKPLNKNINFKVTKPVTTTTTTTPTTTTTEEETTTTEEIITTVEEEENETTESTEEVTEEVKTCQCPTTPSLDFNADAEVINKTGKIRQCNCTETADCMDEMDENAVTTCFDECHMELEVLGANTQDYTQCFGEKTLNGFTSAELCLQDRLGNGCSNKTEEVFIDRPIYSNYTDFSYRNESKPKELHYKVHKKTHETFHTFQRFYHCSKHCIHKRAFKCFTDKGCAIELPPKETFIDAMQVCVKEHKLVNLNLWNTCRCLITKHGLTGLAGQCAVLISPYYLARL